jgi:transcriptional regulator with GAF, ATPase, and Fis domain
MKSVPSIDFHETEDESLKLDEMIINHIQKVLKITKGKIHGPGGAAEVLGVNPSTLRNRMNKLEISYGRDLTHRSDE